MMCDAVSWSSDVCATKLIVGPAHDRPSTGAVQCCYHQHGLCNTVGRQLLATDCSVLNAYVCHMSQVAQEAVYSGADIVNDVSGGTLDPQMLPMVRGQG
jgi:hypothetical protein